MTNTNKYITFVNQNNTYMEAIVGQRIRNSRIQRGYSLQELADLLGVSKQMICKYEQGQSMPTSEKLIAFSKLFGEKVDYFFRQPEVEIGEINFRKKSNFSSKKINALKEEVRIKIENYLYVENSCNLNMNFVNPLEDLIVRTKEDIISAVDRLREAWNIGNDPIHNIIQLLEDKEIKVIEIEDESAKFDGLSTIVDNRFYVLVINKNMPVERKRFTILHELGHLLINLNALEEKDKEKYCHAFASEMLLAQKKLYEEFGNRRSGISLEELKNIQKKYGISITAIVYKLSEMKIISKEQMTKFFKDLNFNPTLKQVVETSRFDGVEKSDRYYNLIYRAVAEEYITLSKASALLQLPLEDLKASVTLNLQ